MNRHLFAQATGKKSNHYLRGRCSPCNASPPVNGKYITSPSIVLPGDPGNLVTEYPEGYVTDRVLSLLVVDRLQVQRDSFWTEWEYHCQWIFNLRLRSSDCRK